MKGDLRRRIQEGGFKKAAQQNRTTRSTTEGQKIVEGRDVERSIDWLHRTLVKTGNNKDKEECQQLKIEAGLGSRMCVQVDIRG